MKTQVYISGFVLFLTLFCFSAEVSAQGNKPIMNESDYSLEWVNYFENEMVRIDTRKIQIASPSDGSEEERVVFRFVNKTAQPVAINFIREAVYLNGCTDCDEGYREFSIGLEPLEIRSYEETENQENDAYYLFSKNLNQTVNKILQDYELTGIKVVV